MKDKTKVSKEEYKWKKPAVRVYPKDGELTAANAAIEAAKAMREVRDFHRQLLLTPANRLKVSAFSAGGTIEKINRNVKELVAIAKFSVKNYRSISIAEKKKETTVKT